jgi:hypothetical protein
MPDKQPSYDLARVEEAGLKINPEVPEDVVAAALMLVKAAKDRIREIETLVKDGAVEWIQANHEIVIGATRYYAGHETDKWTDNYAGTLDAILTATNGDMKAAAECLASGAWKPGACRSMLPEEVYYRLFKEEKRTTLKTGEPRKKQLLEARVEVAK